MRRLLLSFALTLALSALGASSALAAAPEGAQKAPLYGPHAASGFSCESGVFPTPKTFGFVVLNTPGDETTVTGEVSLKRDAPNATYEVVVVQNNDSIICSTTPAGAITTNKKGNGNLHVSVARIPSTTKFWIAIGEASGETYGSTAVEL